MSIVLPGVPLVSAVVLVADPRGWTTSDLPHVKLTLSDSISGKNSVTEEWSLSTGEETAQGAVVAMPGSVFRKSMPKYSFEARLLTVTLDLPDGDDSAQIHLGRLFVKGTRPVTPDLAKQWLSDDQLFVPESAESTPIELPYLDMQILESNKEKLHGTIDCDLVTTPVPIHGFVLLIDHSNPTSSGPPAVTAAANPQQQQQQQQPIKPVSFRTQQSVAADVSTEGETAQLVANDEGSSCQVRLIRVTVVTTTQEAQQQPITSYTVAGKFVVPKCRHGTQLVFRFVQAHLLCSIVRFEYLANYGSTDYTAPGHYSVF